MKTADLHVHTHFSDGTSAPEEVVRCAQQKGLSCIAICDHDSVDGIDPSLEAAKGTALEIIPGVELTIIESGKEIHMLGYFIEWKEAWFAELLKKVQRERVVRMDRMIEKLKNFDIRVDREKVMELAGGKGSMGRLHLARALAEIGAVSSVGAAFRKYIGDFGPCYVEDIGFAAKEAIETIVRAGGVPVVAHPYSIGNDILIEKFIAYGMRGIEVYHTEHDRRLTEKYEAIVKEHDLVITGGSDCHGMGKGRILMGRIKLPYRHVEHLKEEAQKIKERGRA